MLGQFMFLNFGFQELLVIALLILLLFGGAKIPELMRGIGRGLKSFKDGMNEVEEPLKKDVDNENAPVQGKGRKAICSWRVFGNILTSCEAPSSGQDWLRWSP